MEQAHSTAGFVSPRTRRLQASAGLLLTLALSALQIFWVLMGLGIYADFFPDPGDAFWTFYNDAANVFSLIFLGIFLLTGLLFVRWQRLLIRNLAVLGCPPRTGQTLATLSWLIPWVNLFLPYRSIAEIARASRPEGGKNTPALVGIWWASWILSSVLGSASAFALLVFDEQTHWPVLASGDLVSIGCTVLSGGLALWVLQLLSQQQLEHLATVQQEIAAAAATPSPRPGFLASAETEEEKSSEDQEADHQIDPQHHHDT